MMNGQIWCKIFGIICVSFCILFGGIIVIVDPFFHYHKPLSFLEYTMKDERYFNDGIAKHFEYNALITGTSYTENFKSTEFDSLFDVNSIKVPFSAGSYKETDSLIRTALDYNPDVKIILRGLSYRDLGQDKDYMKPYEYPTYLYDKNVFNDISYLLNWEVMKQYVFGVFQRTIKGEKTTTFDEYNNWMVLDYEFGKEAILKIYTRPKKKILINYYEQQEKSEANIIQNVIEVAKKYPDVKFYYFFTPHSIFYFDHINQQGLLECQLVMEKRAIEMMLECDNIYLFSFNDEFDMICNADNYKDTTHYSEDINTWILEEMVAGRHRLTKSNYEEYCNQVYEFYTTYDYDQLFE